MKKFLLSLSVMVGLSVAGIAQTEALTNGDLESNGSGWNSTSTNFGTVICDAGSCGTCGGPCTPYTGTYYAWFGGVAAPEIGTLSQSFNVGTAGAGTLTFQLKMPLGGAAIDSIAAELDGANIWFKTGLDTVGYEAAYDLVSVDLGTVSSGTHTLNFRGNSSGAEVYNVLIDDISVMIGGSSGITSMDFLNGIHSYVNYDQSLLNLSFNFPSATDLRFAVTDMTGRTIQMNELHNVQNDVVTYSTLGWAAGVYNITFIKANSVVTHKVMVR